MPKPIPFPTVTNKQQPDVSDFTKNPPKDQETNKAEPTNPELNKANPVKTELVKEEPVESELNKEVPVESKTDKEMPSSVPLENCVTIDGIQVELKPTKLKYFRNKMAATYSLLKTIPLNELLVYGKGALDKEKDADQVLYDFLVAAFDDAMFVRDHYDNMTADDVEKVFKIFGRLNHIDEKEELQRKNREAQAQAKH